jgi:hypothetical protein
LSVVIFERPQRKRGTESPEYSQLPRWFLDACDLYVDWHDLPDDPFFAALLTGDVKGMVYGADNVSQSMLWLMLKYLYNHVPEASFGSELIVATWLRAVPSGPEASNG